MRGSSVINQLGPLLAVVVGIVHAAIAPVILVGGVKPNVVLVAVVLVTALGGFLPGITWAFIAGLTANLLGSEPLGSVPMGLLVVAALVAGGARVVGRTIVYPILAAFLGSLVADVATLFLAQLVTDASVQRLPTDLILAAAALNAAVCGVLLLPARGIAARWVREESTAW